MALLTYPGQRRESMLVSSKAIYTSKIIKAGALLADTKTLLANWDVDRPVSDNLEQFHRENLFGKASRSRIKVILQIFHQRYLADEAVTKALVYLLNKDFSNEGLNRVLFFHATQSDRLLHDVVTDLLASMYKIGRYEVSTNDVKTWISKQISKGHTQGEWSDTTITRCARELLATLRDFGILQGAIKKRLTPSFLPVAAFAYIALYLKQRQPSGTKLIHDPEWQLFFLPDKAVERLFVEAHQAHLLEFYAAGSIIRIDFPTELIEEYAHVIAKRAY